MATPKVMILLALLLLPLVASNPAYDKSGLSVGYYGYSCPQAESIALNVIKESLYVDPTLAGPLLRMFFHDCFVRGCDASILLDSPTKQGEKDAIPNLTLRGYEIIDKVKSALEMHCPGTVSCADILAIVSRDVVVETGGAYWDVELGRRDGFVTSLTEALTSLPPPFFNITSLINSFIQKGLSVKDLVVLSGAHTLGVSHCSSFKNRLYNFNGGGDNSFDPTMDPKYVPALRKKCTKNGADVIVEMDPRSSKKFDNDYFKQVSNNRGLFQSDAALLDNYDTKYYVEAHKNGRNEEKKFFEDFGVSMVGMGRIEVLTGNAGQVRKVCSKINYEY
ncbi:peroxidase 56-like [Chenopodium quinoa]|uniref:peroxidase 56-like n=1 Tax=Chenopodium quinoa TaxID=63459 RepID=UPI000B776C2B|nr:peroxidase 56-like [Chenopodium quinoa]